MNLKIAPRTSTDITIGKDHKARNIKKPIEEIKEREVIIHVDFSEN